MKSFNELLQQYYEFKKQHSPYDYREWRAGGETARQCKSILDEIAQYIKATVIQKGILGDGDFTVESASGVGYYPKSPWIGIFKNGESAVDGVYPVLGFYKDSTGCFIGCAESFTNPQFGFHNEYCTDDKCSEDEKRLLRDTGLGNDAHLARMPHSFPSTAQIADEALLNALQSAIAILLAYRSKHPRQDQLPECGDHKSDKESDNIRATWYKEILVDDIRQWLNFVALPPLTTNCSWIFRGQGDAAWHLESLLYRHFGGIRDRASIRAIEVNAITTFKRDTYALPQYQHLDGVNILAAMQHYCSATRLLDFTYAPLIALFFAVNQREVLLSNAKSYWENHAKQLLKEDSYALGKDISDDVSLAVWAFNLRSMLDDLLAHNDNDLNLALIQSTEEASKLIDEPKSSSGKSDKGIVVVLPKFGNERLSAQSGLFMMAKDVGDTFEENLRATLPNLADITKADCKCENISSIADWTGLIRKFSVVKFVFPSSTIGELKTMLKLLRITYKTVYPDIIGIAKEATDNC